jgi:hypothetical protein
MRSNIKAKPGSQGTLFQPTKSVLNPQQRWPQGYTPERLNEVRGALRETPITYPERYEDEHEPGDYRQMMGYREGVTRMIAKSTVPAEHLEGLKGIHGEPDEDDYGTYMMKAKTIDIDPTNSHVDQTLIHEIGHHFHNDGTTSQGSYEASREISKAAEKHAWRNLRPYADRPNRTSIAMAENTVQAGVHEALADNYLTEHYRTGGRKSEPVTQGAYQRNFTSDRLDAAYPGYSDVRPHQPSPTLQRMQFNDAQGELYSRTHVDMMQKMGSVRKQTAQQDAVKWARGDQ